MTEPTNPTHRLLLAVLKPRNTMTAHEQHQAHQRDREHAYFMAGQNYAELRILALHAHHTNPSAHHDAPQDWCHICHRWPNQHFPLPNPHDILNDIARRNQQLDQWDHEDGLHDPDRHDDLETQP